MIQPTPIGSAVLTNAEQGQLRDLEAKVETAISAMLDAGIALRRIRDLRLYRATASTFEDYLSSRWNISRRRGYQLIEWANINDECAHAVHIPVGSERQARELAKLPVGEQAAAFSAAVEDAGGKSPSGRHVRKAVARRLPPADTDAAAVVLPPVSSECPRGGERDWQFEGGERFCSRCKDPGEGSAARPAAAEQTALPREVEIVQELYQLAQSIAADSKLAQLIRELSDIYEGQVTGDDAVIRSGRRGPVGIYRGNDAINALKSIPRNDRLRRRGFEIVEQFIAANRNKARA